MEVLHPNYEPLYGPCYAEVEGGKLLSLQTDLTVPGLHYGTFSAIYANTIDDVPLYRGLWEGVVGVDCHHDYFDWDDVRCNRASLRETSESQSDFTLMLAGELYF